MALTLDARSWSLIPTCSSSPSLSRSSGGCAVGVSHGYSNSLQLRSPFCSNLQPFRRGILHSMQFQQSQSNPVRAAAPDMAAAAGKTKIQPLTIRDAKIVAEPLEDKSVRIRVDIDGQASKRAFDTVLKDLARHAPPVPGFRKAKGDHVFKITHRKYSSRVVHGAARHYGKTSVVPLNVVYQLMGPKLVRKFVVEEIIKATLLDYTEKEGIKAKDELKTDQSSEELDKLFEPGKSFGFDATLQLADDQTQESQSNDSNATVDIESNVVQSDV